MKVTKNQKTAAIVIGGGLVLYLLYRWYQGNAAASAANTASGQLTPVSTSGAPTDTSGGGGAGSWGGSGSGGTLDSDLQALMAQDAQQNAGLLAAIQALTPTGVGSTLPEIPGTAPGAPSVVQGMVSGPLNALPIAAQIALVHAGLADPSQLGPKAQQVYAHGDTTLAEYATGQRRAAPRGPTRKTGPSTALTTADLRAIGSQLAGMVNHAYQSHTPTGSAVAPSHHGTKPTVRPAAAPHIDARTGGAVAPRPASAAPHVTTPKPPPAKPTSRKVKRR